MTWFIYSLICLFGWGLADLFYKKAAGDAAESDEAGQDKYSYMKTAVWVGIVMGAGALCLLPFSETGISGASLALNCLKYTPASLGYIISMVIGYAGLRYLELSIVSPVQNASGALSAVLMSVWFVMFSDDSLGAIEDETGFSFAPESGLEIFNNLLVVCGTVIIFAGVIALAFAEQKLSSDGKKEGDRKYRIGALALLFPILYCIFDTVGTAADGIILDEETGLGLGEIDVLVLYGLTFMLAGLVCWIFLRIKTGRAYNPFAKSEKYNAIAALCEEFGQVFYVFAMAEKPVLAAPMIASYCIVSVILSRIFLREKLGRVRYACVFAVIAGIVMLGISDGICQ